jgi:hypothetical protein
MLAIKCKILLNMAAIAMIIEYSNLPCNAVKQVA